MRLGALCGIWLFSSALLSACEGKQRPGFADLGGGQRDAAGDGGGVDLDSALGDAALCGNLLLPAHAERPNLYFLVDRSGSMSEPLPRSSVPKYDATIGAIAELLRRVGHRLNYGAAVLPARKNTTGCDAGEEIFPTTPGDPSSYAESGTNGPVLRSLASRLVALSPAGGTPVAPTIDAITPILTSLAGETFMLLATDGAPNCNPDATCSAAECELNLSGYTQGELVCKEPINCCDPLVLGQNAPRSCIDAEASVAGLAALAEAGVKTYVVGLPGSETFANVLDRLAVAGGVPRDGTRRYYAVSDALELSEAIRSIGVSVALTCEIELEDAPEDPAYVNVYLDKRAVALDAEDGFAWTGEKSIELRGETCDRLLLGDVLEVEVTFGCPTIVK
jgi:hypothetical protein